MSAQSTNTQTAKGNHKSSGSGAGAAASFIVGFAPWIVYWILSGSTSFETAVGVAFAVSIVANIVSMVRGRSLRALKVLEVGTTVAFAALAVVGLLAGDDFIARWIQPLGNGALLLIMLVSLLIGKPFTLQYAREATDRDLWDSPGFLAVNRVMTRVWVVVMALMTAFALVPPIVQGEQAAVDGGTTLSIIFYWVLPYLALAFAMIFTVKFPAWFGAEFDPPSTPDGPAEEQLPIATGDDIPSAGPIQLDALPAEMFLDDVPVVRLTGVDAGSTVTVTAQTIDALGHRWSSRAEFVANQAGVVDSASDAPIAGDYAVPDPAGLIWGMRFASERSAPEIFVPPAGPSATILTAVAGPAELRRTVVRRNCPETVTVTEVSGANFVGRLLLPQGVAPNPGVILVGGSEGGLDSQFSNAALLARHGYAALCVAYFGMDGLPSSLVEIPLEAFGQAAAFMRDHDRVDGQRIAGMAISRGSEGLLSAAARVEGIGLQALVVVSPSSVCWTAVGDQGTIPGTSSWTVGGSPVAHLDIDDDVLMSDVMRQAVRDRGRHDRHHPNVLHLRRAYARALESSGADAAAIPVENIACPILSICGTDDQVWPSATMIDHLSRRRQDAGVGQHDVAVVNEGAGHLIRLGCMPTDVAATSGIALGEHRRRRPGRKQPARRQFLSSWIDVHPRLKSWDSRGERGFMPQSRFGWFALPIARDFRAQTRCAGLAPCPGVGARTVVLGPECFALRGCRRGWCGHS